MLIAQAGLERGEAVIVSQSNTGSNIEVTKPQMFDGTVNKVSGFLIVCILYIRMRMRDEVVKEQVQWILSYV